MAIVDDRIKTVKLIEASTQASSGELSTPSNISDIEPAGLTDLLPPSITQFSNFKDIMNVLSKDVRSVYKDINKALRIPSLGDYENKLRGGGPFSINRNANPINQTLGIFNAVLCGDSKGIDFHLRDLINALAYDFGFLNWNICGRQKLRNPIDIFINSVDNMRKDYNALLNLGPRTMKNLQKGVNNFIKGLNLPKNLEKCMLDNALSNMVIKNEKGIPPGALKGLRDALNPDICKRSDEGVPGYNRTLEKTKITPLVRGLTNYNESTMLAFHGSILKTNQVSNDVVMEVLCDSIIDKDSDTLFKTLQLIAFTKVTAVIDHDKRSDSIDNLTYNIHKVKNSEDLIMDKIFQANESQQKLNPADTVKVDRKTGDVDMLLAMNVNAENVFEHMKDNLVVDCKNPEKKFYQAVKLIEIADSSFKSNESAINIARCDSLTNLAKEGGLSHHFKSTKQSHEQDKVMVDGINYIKVYNDVSLMDQVIGSSSTM